MHDPGSPENYIERDLAESDELLGKECVGCQRAFKYYQFRRDSSMRDGRALLCQYCESSPKLSTQEHIMRLREMNYNSCAVKSQRWKHQEDYQNDASRVGHPMTHSDFIHKLKKLLPGRLYFTDGRIVGDIAVFEVDSSIRPEWNDQSFRYLWYIPSGWMPEFSIYEFDEIRNVPIKEKQRGWRTPLLRLIKAGLLTEEQCDKEFGHASGEGSIVWRRQLWKYRNPEAKE